GLGERVVWDQATVALRPITLGVEKRNHDGLVYGSTGSGRGGGAIGRPQQGRSGGPTRVGRAPQADPFAKGGGAARRCLRGDDPRSRPESCTARVRILSQGKAR